MNAFLYPNGTTGHQHRVHDRAQALYEAHIADDPGAHGWEFLFPEQRVLWLMDAHAELAGEHGT